MDTRTNTISVKGMVEFFESNFKIFEESNHWLTNVIVRDLDGFEYRLPRPVIHAGRKSYKIVILTNNFYSRSNGIETTMICSMNELERSKASVVTAAISKMNNFDYDFNRMFAGELGKTVTFAPSFDFVPNS